LQHFDRNALPHTEFLQAVNLLGIAQDLADFASLARFQATQRYQLEHR